MTSKDATLLRRYARMMFHTAMAEKHAEAVARSPMILPPSPDWSSRRYIAIQSDGYKKLRAWFSKLKGKDKCAARKRLQGEIDKAAKA